MAFGGGVWWESGVLRWSVLFRLRPPSGVRRPIEVLQRLAALPLHLRLLVPVAYQVLVAQVAPTPTVTAEPGPEYVAARTPTVRPEVLTRLTLWPLHEPPPSELAAPALPPTKLTLTSPDAVRLIRSKLWTKVN